MKGECKSPEVSMDNLLSDPLKGIKMNGENEIEV